MASANPGWDSGARQEIWETLNAPWAGDCTPSAPFTDVTRRVLPLPCSGRSGNTLPPLSQPMATGPGHVGLLPSSSHQPGHQAHTSVCACMHLCVLVSARECGCVCASFCICGCAHGLVYVCTEVFCVWCLFVHVLCAVQMFVCFSMWTPCARVCVTM